MCNINYVRYTLRVNFMVYYLGKTKQSTSLHQEEHTHKYCFLSLSDTFFFFLLYPIIDMYYKIDTHSYSYTYDNSCNKITTDMINT